MFETIISLVSGPFLGGLFGCVNAWLASREKKADQAHERAMAEEHRKTRKTEAQCQIEVTKEEYAGRAFVASQQVGNKTALSSGNLSLLLKGNGFMRFSGSIVAVLLGFTDVARHAVRPGITVYLGILCSGWITKFASELGGLTIEKRMEVVNYGIMSYIQLFMVCVSWWFGDRMTTKLLNKKG